MLRLLSIRHFAVVEALTAECDPGFTVLTGETGAGKSILLDALSLLLGDRFEVRQIRPGADRAEIAAEFSLEDAPAVRAWLATQDLAEDDALLVRRVLDAQGRSRASLNGRPATLSQLREVGEMLVDLHGQHAHHSLGKADVQRALLDGYGGFAVLARETATAWQAWRREVERQTLAAREIGQLAAERDALALRQRELESLAVSEAEWSELSQTQSRLANAASLLDAANEAGSVLDDDDAAVSGRLSALLQKLRHAARVDAALAEIADLIDGSRIQLEEAARSLRAYRERVELDPRELKRVEERLAAIHDAARRYRVRPDELPQLARDTADALAAIATAADPDALDRAVRLARSAYDALASQLSAKRRFAAAELADRVSATMQDLAMAGGRFDIALTPLSEPASHGHEDVGFAVATHPKQRAGPLARVASGGELSRVALAMQVVLAEVGEVPTLIFDEVDTGIGGAVAATVGRMLRDLGGKRQILCVTHLPQVAASGDRHWRVVKTGNEESVQTTVERLDGVARVEELARMLGGLEITAKTRAHARELLAQNRSPD